MHSSRLPPRTRYRSIRYSANREQTVRTADPSSVPKFRIKKNSLLESTMMKTTFLENQLSQTLDTTHQYQAKQHQPKQPLKEFLSMMAPQRKMTLEEKADWSSRPSKFRIQLIKGLQDSDFNLFDPFQRHFKAIQEKTKTVKAEIRAQSQEFSSLRGQLANLRKKVIHEVESVEKSLSPQLLQLQLIMKGNNAKQQEVKLRFKQEIAILQLQEREQKQQFQRLLDRNFQLQQSIFDCLPFQLVQNQPDQGLPSQQEKGVPYSPPIQTQLSA